MDSLSRVSLNNARDIFIVHNVAAAIDAIGYYQSAFLEKPDTYSQVRNIGEGLPMAGLLLENSEPLILSFIIVQMQIKPTYFIFVLVPYIRQL